MIFLLLCLWWWWGGGRHDMRPPPHAACHMVEYENAFICLNKGYCSYCNISALPQAQDSVKNHCQVLFLSGSPEIIASCLPPKVYGHLIKEHSASSNKSKHHEVAFKTSQNIASNFNMSSPLEISRFRKCWGASKMSEPLWRSKTWGPLGGNFETLNMIRWQFFRIVTN